MHRSELQITELYPYDQKYCGIVVWLFYRLLTRFFAVVNGKSVTTQRNQEERAIWLKIIENNGQTTTSRQGNRKARRQWLLLLVAAGGGWSSDIEYKII